MLVTQMRQEREASGKTQQEIADRLGISLEEYQRMEEEEAETQRAAEWYHRWKAQHSESEDRPV